MECWSRYPLAYTWDMGYFGGLGAGKGWFSLNFLPDPELLGSLIDGPGLRFFRDGWRPRESPWETRAGIIGSYRELLDAWTSHDSLAWQQALGNRFSVACPPTDVDLRPAADPEFVLVSSRTPAVWFGQAEIDVDADGRCYSNLGKATWIGYRLTFPRVYSSDDTDWEHTPTDGFPEFHLFGSMYRQAKASTVPLVLDHPVRRIRTPFRYSPSLFEQLEHIISTHPVGIRLVRPRRM